MAHRLARVKWSAGSDVDGVALLLAGQQGEGGQDRRRCTERARKERVIAKAALAIFYDLARPLSFAVPNMHVCRTRAGNGIASDGSCLQ